MVRTRNIIILLLFAVIFSGCNLFSPATVFYSGKTDSQGNQFVNVTNQLEEPIITIDYIHHEIHEGKHFFGKNFVDFLGGAGENQKFMFITPNASTEIHAKAIFYGNVEFEVQIIENVTTLTNGTAVQAFNNNRASTYERKLLSFVNPLGVTNGQVIWEAKFGSGKTATGVSPGLNYEIIALPNSKYIFNITKVAVQTGYLDVDFFWYENED